MCVSRNQTKSKSFVNANRFGLCDRLLIEISTKFHLLNRAKSSHCSFSVLIVKRPVKRRMCDHNTQPASGRESCGSCRRVARYRCSSCGEARCQSCRFSRKQSVIPCLFVSHTSGLGSCSHCRRHLRCSCGSNGLVRFHRRL